MCGYDGSVGCVPWLCVANAMLNGPDVSVRNYMYWVAYALPMSAIVIWDQRVLQDTVRLLPIIFSVNCSPHARIASRFCLCTQNYGVMDFWLQGCVM